MLVGLFAGAILGSVVTLVIMSIAIVGDRSDEIKKEDKHEKL